MPIAQACQAERRYSIRLAKPSDLAQVAEMDREITGLEKPGYWDDLFDRYQSRGEDDEEPGTGRQRFFLVAAEGGDVLGFIIGEVRAWEFGSPPCGWVFAIGIRADVRNVGVGHTLFDAISARLRSCGVTKVRTMLARDNPLAMSFFRSQGMMAGPFIQLEKDL